MDEAAEVLHNHMMAGFKKLPGCWSLYRFQPDEAT